MSVTTANTIRLSDVCLEIYGSSSTSGRTLMTAHSAATGTFNPSFNTQGSSLTLLDFRGYEHVTGGGGLPSGGNEILLGVSVDNRKICAARRSAYYSDAASLLNSTVLYTVYGEDRPEFLAPANWYSDGFYIRYWNGSSFEGEILECDNPF